jgi:hypothetical protein
MDKKMFSIIMAILLIVAFFLSWAGGTSGFDMVKSGGDLFWEFYLLALIPLSGLMLLVGALNNGKYPGGRSLWAWLPLLTIIFFLLIFPLMHGQKFGDIIKSLGKDYGIGLWLTIVGSLLLAFYNPRRA